MVNTFVGGQVQLGDDVLVCKSRTATSDNISF